MDVALKVRLMGFRTVLPDTVFGKPLSFEHQGHPSTTGLAARFFNGDMSVVGFLPPRKFPSSSSAAVSPLWSVDGNRSEYYVNVQDCALLHVAALLRSDVANERIFAFAAPFNFNDILVVFRNLYPNRDFLADIQDLGRDLSKVPNEKAEQLLKDMGRPGWTSFEETIKLNVEDLI